MRIRGLYTFLLIILSLTAGAGVYYIAPGGNDANAGTISSPWFSLNRAWIGLAPGDTLYIRGGTYNYAEGQRLLAINGTAANTIKVWAYPGEIPVITKSAGYNVNAEHELIYFEGAYFHFKGIEIANFSQDALGDSAWTAFRSEASFNCVYEQINYHHNVMPFSLRGASTGNLVLNSDFHHNADPFGLYGDGVDPYGGGDGLDLTIADAGTVNTIRGCRAWWNSDDGFDCWSNSGFVTIENCWSWFNGFRPGTFIPAGDGSGYKLGLTVVPTPNILRRIVRNNVSFRNRIYGFNEAGIYGNAQVYNNTSASDGEFGFIFNYSTPDYSGYIYYIRNNISYNNPDYAVNSFAIAQRNSWQDNFNVTAADFQSLDSTQLLNARQTDGSLPDISFLHLASGSALIDSGMVVGIPYFGSAPDLGAFETNGIAPPANQPPVADAGIDQVIGLPVDTVTLDGSASSDPDGIIDNYLWRKISGPVPGVITSPFQAVTVINGLAQGTYLFELSVTDNSGSIDKDTMQVTVNPAPNVPPVANAGIDQSITLPIDTTTLDGSASTDADGTIATYAWNKISGPVAGTISNPSSVTTSVTSLVQGVYQFELTVTDNNGATDKDTMQVTVNPAPNVPPVANAGADQTLTLPTDNTTLDGSASTDADGTITTYAWNKISGPVAGAITSPASVTTSVTGLVQGTYLFELTITDNNGAIDKDTMQVTVNPAPNVPPVANAGIDQSITLPTNNTTLDGSASTDADGTISTYAWAKISGPVAGAIISPASVTTSVTGLVQGTYLFELTVTDNNGTSDKDTMQVTVNPAPNVPPVADAGVDQTLTLPTNNTTLDGSASNDPDGTITTYAWLKISGPIAGTITNPASITTSVTGLVVGVYQFELTVTDNNGATDKDTMQVTVTPAPNVPPVANAGIDQSITLPTNNITLDGSASGDADGTITTYGWNKISGPVAGTITNSASITTTVTGLVQGTYLFELAVTDNNGSTDKDTMQVTVNPAPNVPPVANAGIDQNITLPTDNTTLDGSASNDPDGTIATFTWLKISGPAAGTITNPSSVTTSVTGLVQGIYLFELTVTDNSGATDKDTMQVTVNPAPNVPPVANAGIDQSITLPTNNTTIDGSASTDPDGTIATYAWNKISGPAVGTIGSPSTVSTAVTGLVQGIYLFELTVTDNNGASDKDTMQVTVNPAPNVPPVANAGIDQTLTLPTNNTTLDGSASGDTDGTISTFAWAKISGPVAGSITSPASVTTTVTGLVQGTYLFELTVTDNNGASDKDTMQVTVNPAPNVPPVADAGVDQILTLPTNNTTLDGSASADPDGTIATYAWNKISGPAAGTITSPASVTTSVTGLVQGVYQFELTVTDNNGATDKDTMQVTVNHAPNVPPVANAGIDQTLTLPTNNTTLDGSASTDSDGTITTYAWNKISGPAAGTITSPGSVTTSVTGLVQGTYLFELTVTDNSGATDKDTMQVTVNPAPNVPPVANAGIDQSITLPTNNTTLDGSASNDPDGTIATYSWNKISGPVAGTITNPASVTTSVTSLVQGVYQFELTVTDNNGATDKDTIQVTVNPAPNVPPVANAGTDQTLTLPTDNTTLDGSTSTDPDGTIATYAWVKISGPAAGTITSSGSITTSVTSLVQGVYQFELTVTDNNGATDKDTMQVTVNPAPNVPPVANAGIDQTLTLPTNNTTLDGSASTDSDGTITTYAWNKISGPAAGTITSPGSVTTSVTGLVQGTYLFELTVTDNNGATDKDTMQLTVNPAPNVPPVANAGIDQTLTLPTNNTTLDGSASNDPDGTIATYSWNKISGPVAGAISSPSSVSTAVTSLVQGIYLFELTVTDNNGATDKDTMQLTVNPAPNVPPVANAGADQTITLPTDNTILDGSASTDANGTIASYAWTKISGPVAGTITNPASATTPVTGLVQGTYQFELTVTDNNGAANKDTVQVAVNLITAVTILPEGRNILVKAYPTVVTGLINLSVTATDFTSPAMISIYNVSGNIVYEEKFRRNQVTTDKVIDMTGFISGAYFIEVKIGTKAREVIKVVRL